MFSNIQTISGKTKIKPTQINKENIKPNPVVGKSINKDKKKVRNTTPDILNSLLAPNFVEAKKKRNKSKNKSAFHTQRSNLSKSS
jgi:hypothetical protein